MSNLHSSVLGYQDVYITYSQLSAVFGCVNLAQCGVLLAHFYVRTGGN